MNGIVDVGAEPAVEMDARTGDARTGLGSPELGDPGLALGGQPFGEPPGRPPQRPAHGLDVDEGVGAAVLHRLERPDGHAELLTLAHVVGGDLERASGHAHLHGGQRHHGPLLEPARDRGPVGVGSTEPRRRVDASARERELEDRLAGRRDAALERRALAARIHDKEADPAVLEGRGHPHEVGAARVGHEALAPFEREAIGVGPCDRGRCARVGRAHVVERGARERLARRDLRQPLPCACVSLPNSASGSAPSTSVAKAGVGATTRPISSSSTQSSAKPMPMPPWSSGHRDAEQVRLGQPGPQLRIHPVGGRLGGLDAIDRGLGLEDLARQLADGLLLFAELEVHAAAPSSRAGTTAA